jgi:hypothetical protein
VTHDHARSKAFRWNEDGIAGISDRHQILCFAIALWNGRDPILKERLYGLTGPEGNHGEDVKELYYYTDSTPTHSYMEYLYKYPQAAFPYQRLIDENRPGRGAAGEFELIDTGVFDEDRYFDVFVEYAKADIADIAIRITVHNRGPEAARLELLPTLWFRNTWSFRPGAPRPSIEVARWSEETTVVARHPEEGTYHLQCEGEPELLFTENETNYQRLYGVGNRGPFVKDGVHEYVVLGNREAVNPRQKGTKCAVRYGRVIPARGAVVVHLRLTKTDVPPSGLESADGVLAARKREADEFYATVTPKELSEDGRRVMRQAFAGLLWSKQFYHYVVWDWLSGDPGEPPPPESRKYGRNADWGHLYNADILSMPDKWEYPWYAAWDLAFHCIAIALVDPDFAKNQLLLILREWYMHPNGQLPAYEWALGDVNPPVHAWAVYRVYKIEKRLRGTGDRAFLQRAFHKLMINFTWWVNRKDAEGNNVFQGGFLGLDNIGVFDRSAPLPTGGFIEQSDGTSWMAMYCLNMLAIAFELAMEDPIYEDIASKFWEHFVGIAHAINHLGLWDEEDGFYYDVLRTNDGNHTTLRTRSMVGLIPLFAVIVPRPDVLQKLSSFRRRFEWFLENRKDLISTCADMKVDGMDRRRIFSVINADRLRRVLSFMLDEKEFLSAHGIRSLSKVHRDKPYVLYVDGHEHRVDYDPAESSTGLFGGNSNWRGPVWFPLNYLLVESLQKYHHYFGDDFRVEFPTGSGRMLTLWQVAAELSRRLSSLFLRGSDGRRPAFGHYRKLQSDPHFRDWLLFHEYFHADTGEGLGASHQTGWTALVAKLLQQSGE